MRAITRRKNPRANRSKFTRAIQRIIYDSLKAKLPLTRAVELSGITYATFRDWMIKGRDPNDFFHNRFRRNVKSIINEREKEAIEIIRLAAKGGHSFKEKKVVRGPKGREITTVNKITNPDWKAAARYLELIARETYGQNRNYNIHDEEVTNEKLKIEADITGDVGQGIKEITLEALRTLTGKELEHFTDILQKINNKANTEDDQQESE